MTIRHRKTALVTGASSPIGRHVAGTLAAAGFNIAAQYRRRSQPVEHLIEEGEKKGYTAKAFRYDILDPSEAEALVRDVHRAFGHIDVLVNTIGPFFAKDLLETTPEEWQTVVATNLHIPFNVTHYALPHIVAARGHIVNFAFAGAENLKAWPMSAAYCAAKAGVVVLTKSLAACLAPQGVRVNALCPGLIDLDEIPQAEQDALSRQIPFGRPGKPYEVTRVLLWLVTDCPAYVSGATIPVSGAWEY